MSLEAANSTLGGSSSFGASASMSAGRTRGGGGNGTAAGASAEALFDTRSVARAESAQIMARTFAEREAIKSHMRSTRARRQRKKERTRRQQVGAWQRKTAASPFTVDLVAENERAEEETSVRLREETSREVSLQRQRARVKTSIIHKALNETSELEALRREKKAILVEERRLKALLDLGKSEQHAKQDLLAAQRAERQRAAAVREHKRSTRLAEAAEQEEIMSGLLREKLGLAPPLYANTTFSRYGNGDEGW